ncbi:MAG TPA: hypothetical protein VNV86_15160 [Candidatus Acidoferrum sp.]|nr:hypothetical protein [Candidatus Acidoferrum sp.]
MTFDNVQFDSPKDIRVAAEFADFTYGPGPMNLKLTEPSQLGNFDARMRFVFNKGTVKVSTTF